jgi:hypothetical protein
MWCKILAVGSLLGNLAIGTVLVAGKINVGAELDLGSILDDGRTAIVEVVDGISDIFDTSADISADLRLSVGDSSDKSDPNLVDAEVEVNALGADARVDLDLYGLDWQKDDSDGTPCNGSLLTSLFGAIPDIGSDCNGK